MKRPLVWACSGMSVGITLLLFRWTSSAVLSAVIILFLLFRKYPKILLYGFLTGLLLGVFTGFCYRITEEKLHRFVLQATVYTGVVKDVSEYGFLLRLTRFGDGQESSSARNIYPYYVYVATETLPERKANVTVTGYSKEFRGAENPGQFDAAEYYPSIGCIAEVRADNVRLNRKPNRLNRLVSVIRDRLSVQIGKLFPKETAGLPHALLLGEKSAFPGDQRELYEQFGLAHILAVSGLHVGILAEILLAVLLFLFPRKPAEIIACSVLLLYGMLCGFPISCIRAVFTFFLSLFCGHFKRTYDRLSANCFLFLSVLFLAPYRLTNLSFQLSFAAGFMTSLEPFRIGEKKSMRKIFRTSVLLQAGLLPITLQAFYTVTPIGILLNVFVLSGISAAFVLLILAMAFSFIVLPAGWLFAGPVHYAELGLIRTMETLRKVRFLTVTPGHITPVRAVIFAVFFVAVLVLERKKNERFRYLLLASFVLFLPIHTGTTVASLSVGQGECTVVMSGKTVIVLDCGSSSKEEVGEKILKPFIQYYGYNHVDYLFVSHPDEDHINGIRSCSVFSSVRCVYIAEAFPEIQSLLAPSVASSVPVIFTKGGDSVSVGKLTFRFIPAGREGADGGNDLCQITELTASGYRFLFPGDVSAEILEQIDPSDLHPVYYLKVPHHGSRYSSSESFYSFVTPEISVISVGYNNYGHPSPESVTLASDCSRILYITKTDGAVLTYITKKGIKTTSYRPTVNDNRLRMEK
ncbi:MAG: ComEC/Rec2 family competence protein [Lachnospiraceae bacterium]|nr:ComEC/Rec2 family competence protein [Lachnospiraceae bacterium]